MNEDVQPAVTPVRRSLIRPDLRFGCELSPLILLFSVAFIFVVLLQTWQTFAIGILLLVGGIPALRATARRDPYFSRVWIRALLKYPQKEYPAHPDIDGKVLDLPIEVRSA